MTPDQASIDRFAVDLLAPGRLLIGGDWVDRQDASHAGPVAHRRATPDPHRVGFGIWRR